MRRALVSLVIGLTVSRASAQDRPAIPGGEAEDYLRFVELISTPADVPLIYRSMSSLRFASADSAHPWASTFRFTGSHDSAAPAFQWLAPVGQATWISDFPRDANDGAFWGGRGFTGALSAGAVARVGPITATLYPSVILHQNRDIRFVPADPNRYFTANPWYPGLDFPQRFGTWTFVVFDPGQSGVRLDAGKFTVGVSTENLWWGPGFRNAIIMSSSGPGFPHIDLGTGRPVRLGSAGTVELRWLAGRLQTSDYFDNDPATGPRLLSGLVIGFAPRFVPGLTVGLTRVLYGRWRDAKATDPLRVFGGFFNAGTVNASGTVVNDSTDQLLSLVARWSFPGVGFSAHLEWARNDFSGGLRDFLLEPDHADAVTVGIQQALNEVGPVRWRLRAEATRLGPSGAASFRGTSPYYVHSVEGGYTHRGQLLGAAIGPGGGSHFFGVDRYTKTGRWSAWAERVRYYDDFVFLQFANTPFNFLRHQVDVRLGISTYRLLDWAELGGSIEFTRRLNVFFQRDVDQSNWNLGLSLTRRGPIRRSR